LIALDLIPELRRIKREGDIVRIGALASLTQVAESSEIRSAFPPLREAILTMAGEQIRNQGTIGGNFCRAVPCADTPPICIAGQAHLHIVGPDSERTVSAEDFFTGPRQTILQEGELLTEIQVPVQPTNSGAKYERFSLRTGSALAVASVAARIVLEGDTVKSSRIVLGAVAPIPLVATKAAGEVTGSSAAVAVFKKAAKLAAQEAQPITDLRGTTDYRRDLVEQLTFRALMKATGRARANTKGRGKSA